MAAIPTPVPINHNGILPVVPVFDINIFFEILAKPIGFAESVDFLNWRGMMIPLA